MSENQENVVKQGMSKKAVSIFVIALLVLGGGIAAFFVFGKSSVKNKYFTAEIATYQFLEEEVQDRFKLELDWLDFTENNPTESTIDISAEFNDPGFFGYGMMVDVEEIINNSKISMISQQDMKEKQVAGEISAEIAGMEFSDFRFGLTDELVVLDLPFLKETLQLKSADTGKFLHMMDPYAFDEDDNLDFSQLFETRSTFLTEEDKKHLSQEYGKMLYDEIPEDSFSSANESVTINDETIKAEKIELHLTEEQVRNILELVFQKIKTDDYLKDLMKEQFKASFISEDEIEELMAEFDESMDEAIEEIDDIKMPEGITSTIWVDSGLVVQREFETTAEDNNGEKSTLVVAGTQLLKKGTQTFDYEFKFEDQFDEGTLSFVGNLSRDGEDIKDLLTLGFDDEFEVTYEATETLTKDTRDFTRSLSFDDSYEAYAFVWTGNAAYEKDQMKGEHQFYVEAEGIGQDLFALNLGVENKKIKDVDMIGGDNILDIGSMSEMELIEYVEYDAAEQFMEWYFELLGDMGEFLD